MTKTISARIKVTAVILLFVFIFTGCGPSATFKNPNAAIDEYVKSGNIVGLTMLVQTESNEEIVEFDNKLGIIYSEGYNGSFLKNVVVFIDNDVTWRANTVYVVKIKSVRETNSGSYYITGDIIQ